MVFSSNKIYHTPIRDARINLDQLAALIFVIPTFESEFIQSSGYFPAAQRIRLNDEILKLLEGEDGL